MGHIVSTSLDPPKYAAVLELEDTRGAKKAFAADLERFKDLYFPHPVRFRQVWRDINSKKPLFLWEPVPPTPDFVGIGLVASLDNAEPALTEIRCVPRKWAWKLDTASTIKVWTSEGGSACFWVPTYSHKVAVTPNEVLFAVTSGALAQSQPTELWGIRPGKATANLPFN